MHEFFHQQYRLNMFLLLKKQNPTKNPATNFGRKTNERPLYDLVVVVQDFDPLRKGYCAASQAKGKRSSEWIEW